MSDSLFLPRVVSRERLLFEVIGVVIATLLPTVSAAAQDTPTEQDKERDSQVRIGIYLSGKGVGSDLGLAFVDVAVVYGEGIETPSHDIMPYPFRFFRGLYGKLSKQIPETQINHARKARTEAPPGTTGDPVGQD